MEYESPEVQQEEKGVFSPSDKQVEVVGRVYQRFLDMKQERDKPRHEFEGLTLEQYVNSSSDRYNGIISEDMKAMKSDWQSLSWDHITRGKIKTIISMMVAARPFISMTGVNRQSHEYADDMFNVYEDTWRREKGSYKLFLQSLSACIKGTVIVEEQYVEEKYKRKTITSVDQETGEIDFVEEDAIRGGVGQVQASIVPILDFYPNENHAEIKEDCCKVKSYSKTEFMQKYGKYKNAEFVEAGEWVFDVKEKRYVSAPENTNQNIQVIKYYNEVFDEYIILANGIWINSQKNDKISPLPFDHKRLPFAKTVFELFDEECFYGKSFPDIAKGEQDPANALIRLSVDREILSLNRGFVLGPNVEIDSFELYPGSVKKITGGNPNLPIDKQIMEQEISGANQSGFQLLQMLKQTNDKNSSIDDTAQGVSSGRKTAREAVILDENSKRNAGPFQIHIYKLLWDRAELRVENIKQFYTQPIQTLPLLDDKGNPMQDSEGKDIPGKDVYREIAVNKPGRHPKYFNIKPEMKGCEFHIRFIEDYEMPQNQSARMELAKARLDESKVNPLLNADECTIDYLEAMRSNPDRFYIKPTQEDMKFQNTITTPQPNQQP